MSRLALVTDPRPFAALLERGAAPKEPAWLREFRLLGRTRFEAVGLPSVSDEDWRHTNVRPLAGIPFAPAEHKAPTAAELAVHPIAQALPVRLVLVNGRFEARLSTLDRLPPGVRVSSLAGAADDWARSVQTHFGRIAPIELTPFVALNAATFEDAASIAIDANASVTEPIHIIHLIVPSSAPAAIAPRLVVHAARGSSAVVVETFLGWGEGSTLTNAVTEIAVDDGARVEHVKIQTESDSAWHVAAIAARAGRGARFGSHNVSMGALLARNDIGARLEGEGAECVLYGLYLADGNSHVDNHTWLDHAESHCPSWEMYKGVLAGTARAVFNGRIVVRPGAQKTDAKQSDRKSVV